MPDFHHVFFSHLFSVFAFRRIFANSSVLRPPTTKRASRRVAEKFLQGRMCELGELIKVVFGLKNSCCKPKMNVANEKAPVFKRCWIPFCRPEFSTKSCSFSSTKKSPQSVLPCLRPLKNCRVVSAHVNDYRIILLNWAIQSIFFTDLSVMLKRETMRNVLFSFSESFPLASGHFNYTRWLSTGSELLFDSLVSFFRLFVGATEIKGCWPSQRCYAKARLKILTNFLPRVSRFFVRIDFLVMSSRPCHQDRHHHPQPSSLKKETNHGSWYLNQYPVLNSFSREAWEKMLLRSLSKKPILSDYLII